MLKRSRLFFYGVALAVVLGGGANAFAQAAASEADALFTKLDKNSDGKLARDEIPEDQVRSFERLVRLGDKDKDGILTKEEFQQANKPEERSTVPLGPLGGGGEGRGGDARQRFEMLDRNKDGKVSLDEIPEQIRERLKPAFDRLGKTELSADDFAKIPVPGGAGPGGQRPDPKEAFKQFDKNSDGKLTKEELPEPLRDRLGQIFERLGKTELTQEEWVQAAARMQVQQGGPGGQRPESGELFRRFDANGDGKLSKDELPAEMRERMAPLFERLGKTEFTQEDFARAAERFRGGLEGRPGQNPEGRRPESGRPEGAARPDEERREDSRRAEADRAPEGRRPDGERRDGERAPEARRGEGDRAPEGRRPEGERREGDRAPEARRPEGDRPADGRRPEGDRRPEGERRPEADRRPEGRAPEGRGPEGRGPDGERRPEGPRGPLLIRKLDKNNDGRISKDELTKLADLFDELDTNRDGQLDPAELMGGPMGPPRVGDGPRPLDRRPEGDRPPERRVDGERRPDGDRGPEGRRPEGDRGPDARRPEGERRDPVRPDRPRGEGEERRPERDREQPREGERPRDRE